MVSKFFKEGEFRCKCGNCKLIEISQELVDVLDDVRAHFGKPTVITSGYRCKVHNANVGGAKKSKHLLGIAADIRVINVKAEDVFEYLCSKYPDKYGIGKYSSWAHIDVRPEKARW